MIFLRDREVSYEKYKNFYHSKALYFEKWHNLQKHLVKLVSANVWLPFAKSLLKRLDQASSEKNVNKNRFK